MPVTLEQELRRLTKDLQNPSMPNFRKWRKIDLYYRTLKNGRKQYYIRYEYWSPKRNEFIVLTRMKGINPPKTKDRERKQRGVLMIRVMKDLFKQGVVPKALINEYPEFQNKTENLSVIGAIDLSVEMMRLNISESEYKRSKNRLDRFKEWLKKNGYEFAKIEELKIKNLMTYLSVYLYSERGEQKGQVNRNNHRSTLISMYKFLVQQDVVPYNIAKDIPKLRESPTQYQPYGEKKSNEIRNYLRKVDPHLYLYVLFVEYQFLRSIECARLKCKDIDLDNRTIKVRIMKGKEIVIQIRSIPDIVYREIKNLDLSDPEAWVFDKEGVFRSETKPVNRRSNWGNRYKRIIGSKFDLKKGESIQNHRHTGVVRLMNYFRDQGLTKAEAELKAMEITGHTSLKGIRSYINDLGVWVPQDYSKAVE